MIDARLMAGTHLDARRTTGLLDFACLSWQFINLVSSSNRTSSGLLAYAVLSAACFGTLAILASLAYERGASPLQLLTWRFALAALLLASYMAITRPGKLLAPVADVGRYAVISLAGYGAASICFFFALTHADVAIVAIILYTYPAIVVIAERLFFGVPLTNGRAWAVGLTFAGCVFVVGPATGRVETSATGVLLAFGAAAGYALFTLVSHRWLPGRPRTTLMVYLFVFTAILCGTAAWITSTPLAAKEWDTVTWTLLGAIVLFPTFGAILLYLKALRGLGASRAAIVSTFEPVFTVALAALVLGERLAPTQILGALLILGGIVVAEKFSPEPAIV